MIGTSVFPTWVPGLPTGVPGFPTGVPGFPTRVPGFPTGVPGFPTGVPGFPTGVPGLPTGVPSFPTRGPGFPTRGPQLRPLQERSVRLESCGRHFFVLCDILRDRLALGPRDNAVSLLLWAEMRSRKGGRGGGGRG